MKKYLIPQTGVLELMQRRGILTDGPSAYAGAGMFDDPNGNGGPEVLHNAPMRF